MVDTKRAVAEAMERVSKDHELDITAAEGKLREKLTLDHKVETSKLVRF